MNTVMNLRVPEKARKLLSGRATGAYTRRTQLHEVRQTVSVRNYL
jgi:hypothetical protein